MAAQATSGQAATAGSQIEQALRQHLQPALEREARQLDWQQPRLGLDLALPPAVVLDGVVEAAAAPKLEGAKAPEELRVPRVSQPSVGEPEWKELEAGSPTDEPEERGEGLSGMPSPNEESSLRLPMAMVDAGRSTGSSAGEPVAPAAMRLGTAGGPMEPVELVTDDLRVRLEAVVAMSSEATEEASSSTTPKLWKGE